jgi:hypothetical protein
MADESTHGGHEGKKGHKAVLIFLVALLAYALLPVFGVGFYRNGSGQVFFTLWYLIGFMVLAFFLMHELITPLPPKDTQRGG